MPRASEHRSATITKLLLMGDPGSGKTTSLLSLVKAGFKLRILNYDNGLDPLIEKAKRECPELLDNIEYMSFRERMKMTANGPIVDGTPKAFIEGGKALDKWEDGSRAEDWGPEYIAVFDSATSIARAAYWWAKGLQGASSFAEGVPLKGYNPKTSYYTAQNGYINLISGIMSESFNTNVVFITHIDYREHDGVTKGYPKSIGGAIAAEVPGAFQYVALATKESEAKRIIRIKSDRMFDLKNPRAFDMAPELPMETGLATIFQRQ